MKFRYFSDLHLERDVGFKKRASIDDVWIPVEQQDDCDTVLLLLGDIWNGLRPLSFAGRSWIGELSKRFKAIVLVLGNHDYWGANVNMLPGKWRAKIKSQKLSNVHLLELADGIEQGSVVIDGIRMLGSTMWTDMHRGDPMVLTKFDLELGFNGKPLFNDRNFIRATSNYHAFASRHWLNLHQKARDNLRFALSIGDEPVLLMTHHAPCMLSAPMRGKNVLDSYLYASDLSDLILDHPRIQQVFHGHTHEKHDYMMGDVRIRCNPRGYAKNDMVKDFDPVGFGEI